MSDGQVSSVTVFSPVGNFLVVIVARHAKKREREFLFETNGRVPFDFPGNMPRVGPE